MITNIIENYRQQYLVKYNKRGVSFSLTNTCSTQYYEKGITLTVILNAVK